MASVNHQDNIPGATGTGASKKSQARQKPPIPNRLQSELMALMMGGDSGISAFPEEDNIFCWKGTINGSKDTVFEGTQYRLLLSFPNDYPFKPPRSSLRLSAFIPMLNVRGHICLDILQDKWSSAYDVRTILLSIQSLLGEPNTSSPLNPQAAQLWSNQVGAHLKRETEELRKELHHSSGYREISWRRKSWLGECQDFKGRHPFPC
ncbi:hypothetical protein ACLB2K_026379 [Fragaria x ananassa]